MSLNIILGYMMCKLVLTLHMYTTAVRNFELMSDIWKSISVESSQCYLVLVLFLSLDHIIELPAVIAFTLFELTEFVFHWCSVVTCIDWSVAFPTTWKSVQEFGFIIQQLAQLSTEFCLQMELINLTLYSTQTAIF